MGPDDIENEVDEATDADLEAAFSAGFDGGDEVTPEVGANAGEPEQSLGDEDQIAAEEAAEAERAEAAASSASSAEGDADPAGDGDPESQEFDIQAEFADLKARLRKTEGHLGNIQNELKQAKESAAATAKAAGGDTPTASAVNRALGSTEEFKALEAEFPEFAAAMRAELAGIGSAAPAQAIDLERITTTAREEGRTAAIEEYIDIQHPGWVDTIMTDSFAAWLEVQGEGIQAKCASDKARDTIDVLDEYAAFTEFVNGLGDDGQRYTPVALLAMYADSGVDSQSQREPAKKRNSSDRLKRNVPATRPGSGGGTTQRGTSEEEAFMAGFKEQRGNG